MADDQRRRGMRRPEAEARRRRPTQPDSAGARSCSGSGSARGWRSRPPTCRSPCWPPLVPARTRSPAPGPRLGADLPRPVPLRPLVLLGLRAERHAQLPHDAPTSATASSSAWASSTTSAPTPTSTATRPRRTGIRAVRQGLHVPPRPLRAVPAEASRSCGAAGSAGPTTAFPRSPRSCGRKYKFDSRGTDKFERSRLGRSVHLHRQGARWPSPRATAARRARGCSSRQGYPPEMIEDMGGAGTRTIKMRGGMGLLGVHRQVRHVSPVQLARAARSCTSAA